MTGSPSAWSPRAWAIYLGWVVITLDGSSLNLALPTIAAQLHAPAGGISWVVDAYTLPLASLLLLGGSLGDRVGAARLFRIGAIGFAAASIGCALSPSIEALVASRVVQGVFAAMLLPMVLALFGNSFPDAVVRSKVVNMMTLFAGAGMAIGPFLGGLLTDTTGWRGVFWLTAPIVIVAAVLVAPAATEHHARTRPRFDIAGQVTGTAGLALLVSGLIDAGHATGPLLPATLLGLGAVLLAAFIVIERRASHPMMPLDVFANPGFARAVLGGFAFQFGAYGLQFFLAVYLQRAWELSAATVGLMLVSFAVGIIAASLTLNPMLLRHGTPTMTAIGASTAAVGTLLLLLLGDSRGWPLLVLAELVVGAGSGIYSTALNKVAGGSLGAELAGLASGIYNTARQVGQCVGIAVLGTLAALADVRLGYLIAVALVVGCAAAIAVMQVGRRAPQPSYGRAGS